MHDFFLNDKATTEIQQSRHTLSLHDALTIGNVRMQRADREDGQRPGKHRQSLHDETAQKSKNGSAAKQEQDDDGESCHVRSLIASKHMVNKLRQRPETAGGNAGRLIRNGCGDKRPRKAQLRRFAEAKRRMSNWTDFTG